MPMRDNETHRQHSRKGEGNMNAKTEVEISKLNPYKVNSYSHLLWNAGYRSVETSLLTIISDKDKRIEKLVAENHGLMKQVEELSGDSQAADYYVERLDKMSDEYESALQQISDLKAEIERLTEPKF